MAPIVTGVLVFGILFGAALVGMRLRAMLPGPHLSVETKDTVRLAMGLVSTMAALLLGLLVASAKGTYDTEKTEVTQAVAGIKYLDGILEDYGPEATPARVVLRNSVDQAVLRIWPEGNLGVPRDPSPLWSRALPHSLQALEPATDAQRAVKAQAIGLAAQLGQIRWLVSEQSRTPISMALLTIMIVWMAMIFLSLGVFAPGNATVVAAFGSAALSVAGAIFLILELGMPFGGIVRISSEPLQHALARLVP